VIAAKEAGRASSPDVKSTHQGAEERTREGEGRLSDDCPERRSVICQRVFN
jgi:hypothetical protein